MPGGRAKPRAPRARGGSVAADASMSPLGVAGKSAGTLGAGVRRCASLSAMRLETDRLLLRRPRLSDAIDLLRFLGDAAAMRYTHSLAGLRDCRRHIAGHECQPRKVGFGPWTVLDRKHERIIGFGASRRVFEKAGFEEQRFVPAMNRYLYAHRAAPTIFHAI
jgi:hypothetical protein